MGVVGEGLIGTKREYERKYVSSRGWRAVPGTEWCAGESYSLIPVVNEEDDSSLLHVVASVLVFKRSIALLLPPSGIEYYFKPQWTEIWSS